jgi:hypothetical protein
VSVRSEQGRQLRAECDACRTGQGREIDEQIGLLFVGERQRIAENHAPFGVGVADLDRQPFARAEHIARPVGVRGDRILDSRQ